MFRRHEFAAENRGGGRVAGNCTQQIIPIHVQIYIKLRERREREGGVCAGFGWMRVFNLLTRSKLPLQFCI